MFFLILKYASKKIFKRLIDSINAQENHLWCSLLDFSVLELESKKRRSLSTNPGKQPLREDLSFLYHYLRSLKRVRNFSHLTLIHLEGSLRGKISTYQKSPIYLGRDPELTIAFDPLLDLEVSKKHGEICLQNHQWILKDLDSTNGTFINGKKIKETLLEEGAKIQLGSRGPVLQVSFLDSLESKKIIPNALPGTIRFSTSMVTSSPQSSPITQEVFQEYQRTVVQDIWKAISWQFKILYGIIFLLLAILFGILIYQNSFSKKINPNYLDSLLQQQKNSPELVASRNLAKKELEKFYKQNSQLKKTLALQYKEKLKSFSKELQQLKQGSLRKEGERILQLEKIIQHLKVEIQKNKPIEKIFKNIQKKYEKSVLFIYSEIKLFNGATGKSQIVSTFGTGFFITSKGHIITNKHVIQPWKFGFIAEQVSLLGYTVIEDSHLIAVWPSGEEILNKRKELNFKKGFNNIFLHNLSISNMAFDSMEDKKTFISPGHKVYYQVHQNDNFDLVLLRARGKGKHFQAIPLASVKNIEKLDPVMVLGFPKGIDIMEKGRGQTSPTLGTIRKIEDTIYVSASIIPGNSGGPVFSLKGNVIGISTRVYHKTETLGVCIKSRYVFELIPSYLRRKKKWGDF